MHMIAVYSTIIEMVVHKLFKCQHRKFLLECFFYDSTFSI